MANCNMLTIRKGKVYKKPTAANLAHNSAMTKATYWLKDGDNLIQSHKYENHSMLNEDWKLWIDQAKQRYQDKNKRALRSDAVIIEEGMIVIGSDVQASTEQITNIINDFVKKFEKDNNTNVRHWAYHNHEGHINEKGKEQINRHVHFLFDNVSNDGSMIRRNWGKEYFKSLQDQIYEISKKYIPDIERAKPSEYVEIEIEGRKVQINKKRHEHHRRWRRKKELQAQKDKNKELEDELYGIKKSNFKNQLYQLTNTAQFNINQQNKKLFSELFRNTITKFVSKPKRAFSSKNIDQNDITKRAKQKDLKEEIKKLREDLKSVKAERKDYAKLEQLNKDLKLQIQEKNLSIDELKKELDLFKNELINRDELISDLEIENVNLKRENEFLKAKNKKLESSLEIVLGENKIYEYKIKNLESELRVLKAKSSMFLNLNNELNEKIKSLKVLLENSKKEEKKDLDFIPEPIPDISHLENRNSLKKHFDKDNI